MDWMTLLQSLVSGGGAPATVDLHPQYQKYAIDAQTLGIEPMKWEDWVKTQGYQLDKMGLAQPMHGLRPQPTQQMQQTQPAQPTFPNL